MKIRIVDLLKSDIYGIDVYVRLGSHASAE